MKNITFNYPLGEELLERLLDAYYRKHGVHKYRPETHAPQHLFIPDGMKRGKLEWRQWICRAAASDYRTQSMWHYKTHAILRNKYPPLYTWKAANYMVPVIEHILRAEGFSKWESMSKHIPILADTLTKEFDDDPVNLYSGGSIDSVMKFKDAFRRSNGYEGIPGFGPKIASLLAIFLEEEGLINIEDALPVDVWVQQIFVATSIIVLHDVARGVTLENEIRLFICDLCARRGWNRVDVNHALWFLGNRGCQSCYRHSEMEHSCVLWRNCRGRAPSVDYIGKGIWDPSVRPFRKGGSRIFHLQPVPADSPQQPLFVPATE